MKHTLPLWCSISPTYDDDDDDDDDDEIIVTHAFQ